jgi:PilZ domain
MHRPRRHSRVPGASLSATINHGEHHVTHHAVVDISEGGVRLTGLELPVGSTITFALEGGGLRCHGRGQVVRRAGDEAAITVDRWAESPYDVRALVNSGLLAEASWRDLYVSSWP